jgi:hypothetical protein
MAAKYLCLATIIINHTPNWTVFDQKTMEHAQYRCAQIYPDAPCLVTFVKAQELVHRAICGKEHPKHLCYENDSATAKLRDQDSD